MRAAPCRSVIEPLPESERTLVLDAVRGLALFGVLLINLLAVFRVSLFQHILSFHTHPGWANHAVDFLAAILVEFKAFNLFSLSFGAGAALQWDRCRDHGTRPVQFLLRRFAVLLAIGLVHMVFVWNGDILTLYAVCGFLLIPFLRLPPGRLALAGAVVIASTLVIPSGFSFPSREILEAHAARANHVYASGGFQEILSFRWFETRTLIAPLLGATLRKVLGLMMIGAAVWRSGILRDPDLHRRGLRATALGAGVLGMGITIPSVYGAATGQFELPWPLTEMLGDLSLAFAYGAALLLAIRSRQIRAALSPFAAAGRTALTNYLAQSILLGFVFYGYGLGLFGRLGSAPAALMVVSLYALQLFANRLWLRHYRFGPFEWLWRSLTYGAAQRMRRIPVRQTGLS